MEGCGMKCCKYLMFGFNLIFWLCGLALLVLGILIITKSTSVLDNIPEVDISTFQSASYILIAVGVVAFLVGLFGCCGAIRESKVCLYIFSILVVLILIVELVGAILAIIYKDTLLEEFQKGYTKVANKYDPANALEEAAIDSFYFVQEQFDCCGGNNYTDYNGSPIQLNLVATNETDYPPSCCNQYKDKVAEYQSCQKGKDNENVKKVEGCGPAVSDLIYSHGLELAGFGIALLFVEILGVILACCIIRHIGNEVA